MVFNQYKKGPIKNKIELLDTISHIHSESYKLCKQSFSHFLPNAGNMGVFCHNESEYELLTNIRKELTETSNNPNQKYYRLLESIVIPTKDDIPEATYQYLYIRKPDPNTPQVGDVDFYLNYEEYIELKQLLINGKFIKGARIYDRKDLDMIELYDESTDVLAYVSTKEMTEKVRVKQSEATKL